MGCPSKSKFFVPFLLIFFVVLVSACSGGGGNKTEEKGGPAACEENPLGADCLAFCSANPTDPLCDVTDPPITCPSGISVDCDGDGLANNCDAFPNDSTNNGGSGLPTTATCDVDRDGHVDVACTGASPALTAPSISCDNCIGTANADQANDDGDSFGNVCDTVNCVDGDGDAVCDSSDNCPLIFNADQTLDIDGDGIGDACDDPSVTGVAAGGRHSLALKSDGTVWAWGENLKGQLGNDSVVNSFISVQVTLPEEGGPLKQVKKIAGGFRHSMALKEDSTIWTWGSDEYGQLGDGAGNIDKHQPVRVNNAVLENVTAIAAGDFHSVALDGDGNVWTWGRNTRGQLGLGTSGAGTNQTAPVRVTDFEISEIIAIAAGANHTVVLRSDGKVFIWGEDVVGQLGNGLPMNPTSGSNLPVEVDGLASVAAIDSGSSHILVLMSDGTLKGWGSDGLGQLANDSEITNPGPPASTNPNDPSPVVVGGLTGVSSVATGGQNSFALMEDGRVLGWGKNSNGELCNGSFTPVADGGGIDTPQANYLAGALAVDGGQYHTVALMQNRVVMTCGSNNYGQLGRTGITSTATPVPVEGL